MQIVYSGVKNNIGYHIRKLRQARDFNQGQVAEKLGITASAYSKIEAGTTDPSVGRLEQIAGIFKVNVTDFFTDPQVQSPADPGVLQGLEYKLNFIIREVEDLKKEIARLGAGKGKKVK